MLEWTVSPPPEAGVRGEALLREHARIALAREQVEARRDPVGQGGLRELADQLAQHRVVEVDPTRNWGRPDADHVARARGHCVQRVQHLADIEQIAVQVEDGGTVLLDEAAAMNAAATSSAYCRSMAPWNGIV